MNKIYKFPEERPAQCFDEKSNSFFVQYTCVMSEQQMAEKYNQMCLIVAIGVLTCLLFLVAIRSKVLGNKINVIEWDINTVTLPDYSVEMSIDLAGYRHWFNQVFHGPGGDYTKNISPGMSLKRFLIRKIEKQLTSELKAQQAYQKQQSESVRMNMMLL